MPNTFRFSMLPLDGVVPPAQMAPMEVSAGKWNATRSACGSTYSSQINFDWRTSSTFNIRFEYLDTLSPCGEATMTVPVSNPELVRIRCLDTVTTAHEIGHILGFEHRNVAGDLMHEAAANTNYDVEAYHIRTLLEKYF